MVPNISVLNETNGGNNALPTQPNTNSNTNINIVNNTEQNKFLKNKLTNIKFNIGKSNQIFLNSKNSATNLKKNAGSACELIDNNNNYLKKAKTKNKNLVEINNINPLGYLYSENNQKSFLSPQNHNSNPKIIFLNDKKKYFEQNMSKDSKINLTQGNEQNTTDGENKKNHINCLLRNTFTNVKIYPTTILNNKIIYNQIDKNNPTNNNNNKENNKSNKNNKNENSNNNSSMHHNSSKIKKEKIVIETVDKKTSIIHNSKNSNISNNENFNSIEELHYFYVSTLQKGKKYAIKLDNCND